MALIEQKRLISKDGKMGWTAYDTNFVDNLNDYVTIYRKADEDYYTDDGYTAFNLDCFAHNWRAKGVVEKICKRYGCKLKSDNEEIQAPHDYELIQAILAIYAWIEFKGVKL